MHTCFLFSSNVSDPTSFLVLLKRYKDSELHGDTRRNESSRSASVNQSYGIYDLDKSQADLERFCRKDGDTQRKPHLTFEYLETDRPHLREPLAEKA